MFSITKADELVKSIPYSINVKNNRKDGFTVFLNPYLKKEWMMVVTAEDHLFVVINVLKDDIDLMEISSITNIPIKKRGKTCLNLNKNCDHIRLRIYEDDDIFDFSGPQFKEFISILKSSYERSGWVAI